MAIDTTIPPFLKVPDSSDTPEVFNDSADYFVAQQAGAYRDSLNLFATEANAQAVEVNNNAAEAATSATSALASKDDALISKDAAAISATEAANSAAGVNLPPIQAGDVKKILEVNATEDGYDLVANEGGGAFVPQTGVKDTQNWDGIAITQAEVEAMGMTVQGTGFSALIYPDGSIVGSTSNGNFEIRPNGVVESEIIFNVIPTDAFSNMYGSTSGITYRQYVLITNAIVFVGPYTISSGVSGTVSVCEIGLKTQTNFDTYTYSVVDGMTLNVTITTRGRWK